MTETTKGHPVPKTDMRPNIEISHALNGRVKDYAAENDMTTAEAYRLIIETGLRSVQSEGGMGGMDGDESDTQQVTDSGPEQELESESDPVNAHTRETFDPIVEEIATAWDDDGRKESRKNAAQAALDWIRREGQLGKQTALEEIKPIHGVDGQDKETWWRQNCREVVSSVGTYSKAEQAYVFDT